MCSGSFDGLADSDGLVGRQVIHDDNVAGLKCRHQHLLDISDKSGPIHGAIEHHGRRHSSASEGSDEGGCLPVAMGDWRATALASFCTAIEPSHLGRCTRLVDEDQLIGIEVELTGKPGPATGQNIRTFLFGGVCGFF